MSYEAAVKFSTDDAVQAAQEWGANCGPGAIAAVLNYTLEGLRPHLGDFERKRYMSPSMMFETLRRIGVPCTSRVGRGVSWPLYGLARVQWEGPWMAAGVPVAARYRHTHWVGFRSVGVFEQVFDINAICVGGWIAADEWITALVPWLLRECEPKADGHWHLTHAIEINPAVGQASRVIPRSPSCR